MAPSVATVHSHSGSPAAVVKLAKQTLVCGPQRASVLAPKTAASAAMARPARRARRCIAAGDGGGAVATYKWAEAAGNWDRWRRYG